ncbi:LysE family translocator [Shewanella baltica]|uniref:LysE family translocator n=1 Tax=Shewanella baltica TaxID=62322 RepID=UPI0039AFADF9
MELLSFAVFGLLIVVSPGADFVLVFKNSAIYGRKAGVLTALGIGIGVCVHITYSVIGISHLVSQNAVLFSIVKYVGAAYLIYLGVTGLVSSKLDLDYEKTNVQPTQTRKYIFQGFLCNTLNPKTMIFFLSVFSQLISSDNESMSFAITYGFYIAFLHAAWFCIVAYLVTSKHASNMLKRFGHRINQACGFGLIAFGAILSTNA